MGDTTPTAMGDTTPIAMGETTPTAMGEMPEIHAVRGAAEWR